MKYDDVLKILGEFGRFQKLQCLLVCVVTFTLSLHSMNMVFVGPTPEHWCTLEVNSSHTNLSRSDSNLHLTKSDGSTDSCHIYEHITNNENYSTYGLSSNNDSIISCPNGWTYSQEYYTNTIVSEVSVSDFCIGLFSF